MVSWLFALLVRGSAQPLFPDGVGPITRSMSKRYSRLPTPGGDDKTKVDALLGAGINAVAEDVGQVESRNELKQAAYARIHLRTLWTIYAGGCPRDMSGCPTNWIATENKTCEPPSSYGGLCRGQSLDSFSTSQKEEFAWKCRASWPCVETCKKNFEGCPSEWSNLGHDVCSAPAGYAGICSPVTDFAGYTPKRKAEWATLCSTTWPCL